MSRKLLCLLAALLLVGAALKPTAAIAQEQIGLLQFDPGSSGVGDEFDILNITGVNSGLGFNTTPTYVTNSVSLSDLSLTVYDGSTVIDSYGSSYFTLQPDGISFNGGPEDFTGATSAVLTGDFSTTTLDMSDGSTDTIDPTFSTTISDPTGLVASTDYAYITATNAGSGPPPPLIPEPDSFIMVGTGLTALAGIRRRFLMATIRRFARGGF